MQTREVRGQKMPDNANVIYESSLINNREGWNKRAEGANFETLINEQGEI